MSFFFHSIFLPMVSILTILSAYESGEKKEFGGEIRRIEDFEVLSYQLKAVLPQAKLATVCLDLGGGASGSGVVVSENGLILSAAHVTMAVGQEITVKFENGAEAKAVGLGMDTSTDAAMAQIMSEAEKFSFVEVSPETSIGQYVFSLGHSGGFDVSRGSVLRLGRIINLEQNSLQTDCSLIGGDSGGPLFDLQGRVIAIHSRVGGIVTSNTHVPISVFQKKWQSLLDGELMGDGTFADAGIPFLGMQLIEKEDSLYVISIEEGSLASKQGVMTNDVLQTVNTQEVQTAVDLLGVLKELRLNDKGLTLLMSFKRGEEIYERSFYVEP